MWRKKHPDGEEIPILGRGCRTIPYVNIKIIKDGVTAEQKAQLIQGVTKLLADLLGKNPQTTYIVIDEVETDNWGVGGETLTARRKCGK